MKILSIDPSNLSGGDPMAAVLLESSNSIHITGAKTWNNTDFSTVESDIARIYHEKNCDYIAIERNSMGKRIAHALIHEHNLAVKSFYTARAPKTEKLDIMDKMEHTNWILKLHSQNRLKWVTAQSQDMKELHRQWNIFGEYKKGTLAAPSGEHDDLMMALLGGTFVIRRLGFEGTLFFMNINDNQNDSNRTAVISELNNEVKNNNTGLTWKTK